MSSLCFSIVHTHDDLKSDKPCEGWAGKGDAQGLGGVVQCRRGRSRAAGKTPRGRANNEIVSVEPVQPAGPPVGMVAESAVLA